MSNFIAPPVVDLVALINSMNVELEERLFTLTPAPSSHAQVIRYLTMDLQSIRFNLCNDALAVGDAWRSIRGKAEVLDLVIDLTTSLRLHANVLMPDGWHALFKVLADALGCFNTPDVQSDLCALVDTEELERFVTPDEAAELIESNPWWITLYLLRRCPVVLQHMSETSAKAAAAISHAQAD